MGSAHVNVDGEWIPVKKVEFLDMSEDFQGYDLMKFEYKGKVYETHVVWRPTEE